MTSAVLDAMHLTMDWLDICSG